MAITAVLSSLTFDFASIVCILGIDVLITSHIIRCHIPAEFRRSWCGLCIANILRRVCSVLWMLLILSGISSLLGHQAGRLWLQTTHTRRRMVAGLLGINASWLWIHAGRLRLDTAQQMALIRRNQAGRECHWRLDTVDTVKGKMHSYTEFFKVQIAVFVDIC